jgi:hypothetical protein
LLTTLPAARGGIECLQFDAEKIISGSNHKEILVYDFPTASFLGRLNGHMQSVFDVRVAGDQVVSCGRDKVLWSVWNTLTSIDYSCVGLENKAMYQSSNWPCRYRYVISTERGEYLEIHAIIVPTSTYTL